MIYIRDLVNVYNKVYFGIEIVIFLIKYSFLIGKVK